MSHHGKKKNKKNPHPHHQVVTLDNFIELGKNAVINSPRSIEACLRLGLDTAALVPKNVADYSGMFVPEFVANVKWEHAEQRRTEALNEAIAERRTIIAATTASSGIGHSASAPALTNHNGGMSNQDIELAKRTEQMLEQERARLRKAKTRQQAEIKSILDHETYLVKLHQEAAMREIREAERMAVIAKKREASALAETIKRDERRAQLLEMREQVRWMWV